MATAPVRPHSYSTWLTEATSTTPAPADARRHALCLFGQAALLFTRWCPSVLAPELCNRQTFNQYDESVWDSIADSTHLVVIRGADVSAVWRDRKCLEEALRTVHVVLLFPEHNPQTQLKSWFLAEQVGMSAPASIFLCVNSRDLYKKDENAMRGEQQPEMKMAMPGDDDAQLVTVAASAAGRTPGRLQADDLLLLKRRCEDYKREAPLVVAEHARKHAKHV